MGCYDSSVVRPLLSSSRTNNNQEQNNGKYSDNKTSQRFHRMVEDYEDVDGASDVSVKFRKRARRLWCLNSFGCCYDIAMVFRKIWLLLWKNMLFRKRHYIVTAMEIVLPTLFAFLLAYTRTQSKPTKADHFANTTTVFPELTEEGIDTLLSFKISCETCIVAYAPENDQTRYIIEQLRLSLPGTKIDFRGYTKEVEIESTIAQVGLNETTRDTIKAAIIFPDNLQNLQGKVRYTIRMVDETFDTRILFPLFQLPGPDAHNARHYSESGFAGFQMHLDKILMKMMTNKEVTQKFLLQAFPYPPFIINIDFSMYYFIFLPQFISLGFILIVPSIIRGVVSEKETGIKELMKMMGLPNWMHWFGWMLNSMFVLTITITIVTFLFFYPFDKDNGAVLVNSDPTVWWFVLFLYSISSTSFCFFIASFFQKPNLAITFGIVLWLVSYYALSVPLEQKYRSLTLFDKLSVALVPNMGLYWAIKVMYAFELKAAGARWFNIMEPISTIDPLNLFQVCSMLIISSIMYILLTLYIECVLPSEFRVRKPWYFIFKPSTWCLPGKVKPNRPSSVVGVTDVKPGFEQEPSDLVAGVEIQNLKKVFGKNKVAVNGVTIKMYDGQITALLGHNGAGKTTTMSMLTGMFAPTSGTAVINGHDIMTDMDGVRENLGLCPQHNMLFDKLTVEEHMEFFGRLKGLSTAEAKKETKELLSKLKMEEKTKVLAMALSGGQKRRLSLANALIGGSKVVILDEPTSGLDPEARREVWNVLLEMRGHRTIVLTTHFMEEADVLGDRIAIMADGKIQCSGTPMFLKKFYGQLAASVHQIIGAGCTLSMTVTDKAERELILLTVQNFVSNASFKPNRTANALELAITLPTETSSTSVFPDMFGELSQNKTRLGIETIGLALTTMDEVFVKVGELSHVHEDEDDKNANGNEKETSCDNDSSTNSLYNQRLQGLGLVRQQFWALFMKRFLYTLRKRRLVLSQLLIPVLSLIVAILISNSHFEPSVSPPPLTMSLDSYKKPISMYSSTADDEGIGEAFKNIVGGSAELYKEKNVVDGLVDVGRSDFTSYRERYIIAADFNSTYAKAMFSTIPAHASPLAMNIISNSLLQTLSPSSQMSIEVTNHPLHTGLDTFLEAAKPNPAFATTVPILFAVFLPLGLALLAASYIVFPVEERLCKAKQLQTMTGVSPLIYWGSSFVWDFFVMMILICVMLICFPIFQNYGVFTAYGGAGVVFLILLVYGFSAISFSYLCSTFVSTVPGGFAMVTIIHVATGMILCLVVFLLELAQLFPTADGIRHFGRFFPTFGASISTMRFTEMATRNSRCNILSADAKALICDPKMKIDDSALRQCCDNCLEFPNQSGNPCFEAETYINWMYTKPGVIGKAFEVPGIGQELLYMFLAGIGYLFILIILEYGILHKIFELIFKTNKSAFKANPNDADVVAEVERVDNQINGEAEKVDALIVDKFCKCYGSFAAVSNLSFGVHHGECFGLLGVNGAGKTTTFRMLTGDEFRSHGTSYALMYNLQQNEKNFLTNIGYCPQFDGIVGVLTGKEMLQLFGRLRGCRPDSVDKEAEKWLAKLGLTESANVQCQRYSGGMKRRLSAGMAMIGDPPIILLDEPTSGVDPISRRQFWKIITSLKDSGQAIVLTSHSMEECEVLCSRLGIMVNGQLQCLGGVQHLKNKFAQGYTLTFKFKPMIPPDSDELKALTGEIEIKFDPCVLKDQHQNILQYQVLDTSMPWDVLFRTMEDLKTQYENLIEEYSVSETTLEEVFLSFARQQYAHRGANVSMFKKIITCQCCS